MAKFLHVLWNGLIYYVHSFYILFYILLCEPRWLNELGNNSYKPITNTAWARARLCKLQKKGALDSQLEVITFISCLPIVGGSLRVLWLLPPLNLFAMI